MITAMITVITRIAIMITIMVNSDENNNDNNDDNSSRSNSVVTLSDSSSDNIQTISIFQGAKFGLSPGFLGSGTASVAGNTTR